MGHEAGKWDKSRLMREKMARGTVRTGQDRRVRRANALRCMGLIGCGFSERASESLGFSIFAFLSA